MVAFNPMTTVDQPLPVAGGAAKRAYVRQVFEDIAPRYDLLNHVLSLNADRRWRRAAVDTLRYETAPNGLYLDLCAGTLDLSAELAGRGDFTGTVIATDFVTSMLRLGRGKAERVAPATADALTLPFADAEFDGAMVGFGVRNLMDLDAGLREAARVLKPGARFVVLEFTTPAWQPFRAIYLAYLQQVLPRIGRMVSKHRTAYQWLPASVLPFPEPPVLAQRLVEAGFRPVTWQTVWGGIVAIHCATRATA